ncbi:MAG: PDDEXK nuclease domain-containing protein [Campylobacterota bacterium]|nr:PDDEXK nuclease domain-containing protein [Campylobacterota bacterium]
MSNEKNIITSEYKSWLTEIKQNFQSSQIKAAVQVNSTLLEFYWELGNEIVQKQEEHKWGSGFLQQLSYDLMDEFPKVKGFSYRNLRAIKQWFLFWQQVVAKLDKENRQQVVANLFLLPWGHNLTIIQKCKDNDEALFYVQNTIKYGISRSVLIHQIETNLYKRDAKAVTNFETTLPPLHSDLAKEITKDPYSFDFLTLSKDYHERELEDALNDNPTIGILICKSKNDIVVEYSLKNINQPLGVSEYQLTESLPKEFQSSLPSIEEIEAELEDMKA